METFVRKDFYLEPPGSNATPEEWQEWLKKDNLKARGAKAAFTRTQKAQECSDPRLNRVGMVKLGGVWRQSVAMFSGSAEEGTVEREVVVEAEQERDLIRGRMQEAQVHVSGQRKHRNSAKRQKIRQRKRSRYQHRRQA